MWREKAVVFMEKPCEFEWLRGNLFSVFDPNTGLTRIVEGDVLATAIANAARPYRGFRKAQCAEVIQFPRASA